MTSVPNRLQQLSGNSSLLAVFVLFFTAVNIPLPVNISNSTIPVHNDLAYFVADSARIAESAREKKGDDSKGTFKVVMLLPFGSNRVFINDLNEPSGYYFPEQSQLSAEYYQGAIIALDSLGQRGLKVTLIVRDVGMDTNQLKQVLTDPALDSADLIIGPVGNSSLRMTCDYSMQKGIWMISPFSVATRGHSPNPYYILANATLRSHCEKIYKYINRNSLHGKIIMVYRKRPADLELLNYFKEYGRQLQDSGKASLQFIELNDSSTIKYSQIKDVLSDAARNLIVIPSNDESFVRMTIKQLNGLTNDYLMDVYGMPTWINFDHIPKEQLSNVSARITQNFWLDKTSPPVARFREAYEMKFKVHPTEYAVKGYDQMMYFGGLLLQQGTDFENSFNEAPVAQLAEWFSIAPVYQDDSSHVVLYNENKSVIMLHYEADSLKKINY